MSQDETNSTDATTPASPATAASARLQSLPSSTRTTGADAVARSNRIKRLRIVLPIVAVMLIVVFAMTTRRENPAEALLQDFEDIATASGELQMANPRFAGVDDDGTPFEITADSATQDPTIRDVIELNNPRAIQGEAESQTFVSAQKGVFRSDDNILDLTDAVTLERDFGAGSYQFTTAAARVSIKDEIVTSDTSIGGLGPDGTAIKADSMRAYNDDGRVILKGNVSMRIYPKGATPDATTTVAEETIKSSD